MYEINNKAGKLLKLAIEFVLRNKIDKKCDNFEKALEENNEKDMKKYANGISKDLEKISLISQTVDRGREILNKYELMQNKGSTELSSIEQELCMKLI